MFKKFISNTFNFKLGYIILAASFALSACGGGKWGFPYKVDVQQGNWITANQVEQLEEGMSKDQVQYLLGTPVLQNVFRDDRWDYPYYTKPGYGEIQQRTFTVWFDNDYLVRWGGDDQPNRQPFERSDSASDSIQTSTDSNNDFNNQFNDLKDDLNNQVTTGQDTVDTLSNDNNLDKTETFGLEADQGLLE